MREQGNRHRLPLVDWLLILVIVAIGCAGVLLVAATPPWWKWCLDRLDVRDWGVATRTIIGAALLAVLLGIRSWPERKR